MDHEHITVHRDETTTILMLDRPAAMNALSDQMMDELIEALETVEERDQARAVILTGTGNAFCAGADLKEMKDWGKNEARSHSEKAGELTKKLEAMDQVTVAAVNGVCLGGGQELALACDFRIAADDAVFGQPEVRLGIIPGDGATARLTKLVGLNHARHLILTGRKIGADKALQIGLVDDLFPGSDLIDEVKAFVQEIVDETAPQAYAAAKQLVRDAVDTELYEAIEDERDAFAELFGTHDQHEGVTAFLEKRDPEFTGE